MEREREGRREERDKQTDERTKEKRGRGKKEIYRQKDLSTER